MTERASGWYDDPNDDTLLRYWDGILWSDRTMPKLRPGLDHVGEARPAPPVPTPHQTSGSHAPSMPTAPWAPGPTNGPHGARPAQARPAQAQRRAGENAYAGLGRRVGAAVLDWLLVSVLVSMVATPFLQGTSDRFAEFNREQIDAMRTGSTPPELTGDLLVPAFVVLAIVALVLAVYDAILTSRGGQTVGRMALSTRVAGPEGAPVSFGRALGRSLLKWLPAVAGPFGMLLSALVLLPALSSSKRQGLHDRMAHTEVRGR